jgi:membrane-associated protease RseP (regulator of RpoE activity)
MPGWALYTLGVLIFAVGLLVSIALHEIGHMVPAKKFGVKVTQYMVGFGPTLWSRKRGDTEYGLKAIPLGGYIRMIGMVPPRADGSRSRWPRRLATAVEDFRQVSRAEVRPEDSDREFYRLTPGKKMIVMLGGPCMNLLIYLVLTTVLLLSIGLPHQDETTKIASIVKCVVPANSAAAKKGVCPANAHKPPAFHKLKPGDTILSINGVPATSWHKLVSLIAPSAGKPLQVVVERAGGHKTLSITPVKNLNYVGNSTKVREVGFLGISPAEHDYFKIASITAVPGQIGHQIGVGLSAIGSYPQKIGNLWGTVFDGKKRESNGAVGVVGIGRIGGDLAESHRLDVADKVYALIGLLASVNLLLFFFNLLPLLPLDGGHVAGAIVEAARRGRARLRARRHPAADGADGAARARPPIFVDTAQMIPVMYAVASVLLFVTLLTLYADIFKPINPFGG